MHWKFWQKKPQQDMEFWSVFDPLNDPLLDYLWPQPASNFFPEWFKNVPRNIDKDPSKPTIRKCPVFPEFMTTGYTNVLMKLINLVGNGIIRINI